jgi:hypothetical protein
MGAAEFLDWLAEDADPVTADWWQDEAAAEFGGRASPPDGPPGAPRPAG